MSDKDLTHRVYGYLAETKMPGFVRISRNLPAIISRAHLY